MRERVKERRRTDPEYRDKQRKYSREYQALRRKKMPGADAAKARSFRANNWKDGVGKIYFLLAGEHVKIGFTIQKLEGRIAQLQLGNPHELKLLGWIEGTILQETEMHDRFRHLQVRSEWFLAHQELLSFAASITTSS